MTPAKRYGSEAELMAALFERKDTGVVEDRGAVMIYHVVFASETFDDAAQAVHLLILHAQTRNPGQPRHFFLDIDGHRNDEGGFDHDMAELQQQFIIGNMATYLTEVYLPLIRFTNPRQTNEVPDVIEITPHGG